MRITEIFFSIQGESSYTGRPCVFVRLTGCPLRCTWCDTAYAFHGGTERSLASIREHALTDKHTLLLSPVFGELDPRTLAEWVLVDRLPVRLQLQLHKLIWDPAMRGV